MYRYEFNEVMLDNAKNGLIFCVASVEANTLPEAKELVVKLLEVSVESLKQYKVSVVQISPLEFPEEGEEWKK